jgi:radical SAM-linked protein
MRKLRLEITKGEAVRYISHLDYSRAVERALRRAKLPVAYSEGFNPHMKMAFASALSLGVTSDAEYLDVEVTNEISAADFRAALAAQLPEGIEVRTGRELAGKHSALMAMINLASYRIDVPLAGEAAFAVAEDSVRRFDQAQQVLYVKESPKGNRQIDVKQYVVGQIGLAAAEGSLALDMAIKITPTGSVKPSAVLTVLVQQFGLEVDPAAALINRRGLYVIDGGRRFSPLDVGTG